MPDILLLCNCHLFCSLLSEWSGPVNTKSYQALVSLLSRRISPSLKSERFSVIFY